LLQRKEKWKIKRGHTSIEREIAKVRENKQYGTQQIEERKR
jgi:hypothetical protein